MSWFSSVKQELRGLGIEGPMVLEQYLKDDFSKKVNLCVGFYDVKGKPLVLPVVRATEKVLASDETSNKEYLPVFGLDEFTRLSTAVVLGNDSPALIEKRTFGVQTIGGTGALTVGALFLVRQLKKTIVYCPNPGYENHQPVLLQSGFQQVREYRYWDAATYSLDIEGFLEDLDNAPEDSVIILHACGHNPTGCDPTKEQWVQIAQIMKRRKLFPIFDSAYQGFISGDLDKDIWAVRFLISQGLELFCAQSFSKTMALYNERVGNLIVVMNNPEEMPAVKSQMTLMIRAMYSNPPNHGARIAAYILSNKELFEQWKDNVRNTASQIKQMRILLRKELELLDTLGTWNHITDQVGAFCYTGLNRVQAERMMDKHHIYMLRSGRIAMGGVTANNVKYIAESINEVLTYLPED